MGSPTCSVPARAGGVPRFAFLQDSFRPFYLAGAVFAALAVPLWLGMWYHGYFMPSLPPLLWHMHEMVFGFAVAIIVGFLFTAARNWTGLPLPAGAPLALVFLLWMAGRIGMFFAYGRVTAVVDSLLLVTVASVLAQRFIRARSVSSMPLVIVLLALGLANAGFHASMHQLISVSPVVIVEFGLMLVVLITMIVGGRVVPGFTASAIPGVRQFRSPWLHGGSLVLAAAAFLADALALPGALVASLSLSASIAVAVQAVGWNPIATRSRPILWVLHISYAWIPVGLALLGLSAIGLVPRSAPIHALAVGAMSGLIIGMITRTALGHSGRPVRAGRWETSAYVLVQAGAVFRVAAALVPAIYLAGLAAAGIAWLAAFVIYACVYAPILVRARPAPA